MLPACMLFIALVMICGVYCVLATRNMLRAIIGIELLMKGVTLLFIAVGHATGNTAMSQAFVITVIVVEVAVTVIAGGMALRVFRHTNDLDVRKLTGLKG
jgi:multisubunit Na+/H+ antiporter MnhC subunit